MTLTPANHIAWHDASVTRARREAANGHRAFVVWFTGLSGAGKSTLAHAVEEELFRQGRHTFVFDGDNVRHGLCSDLGFSPKDRQENLRRIAEMTRLFIEAGTIVLAAFISPMSSDRERVRQIVGAENFIEIFVSCPLEICEQRDVKGVYRRARAGEIPEFTGISAPYEAPEKPALAVDTSTTLLVDCVTQVLGLITSRWLA